MGYLVIVFCCLQSCFLFVLYGQARISKDTSSIPPVGAAENSLTNIKFGAVTPSPRSKNSQSLFFEYLNPNIQPLEVSALSLSALSISAAVPSAIPTTLPLSHLPSIVPFQSLQPHSTPSTTPSNFSPSKVPHRSTHPSVAKVPPTFIPTSSPISLKPSSSPSAVPTSSLTLKPSLAPSKSPSNTPSNTPSKTPSKSPSNTPSKTPSKTPSSTPSSTPSNKTPSSTPTKTPPKSSSFVPSLTPTNTPSSSPSVCPTRSAFPTRAPSTHFPVQNRGGVKDSKSPVAAPTVQPTIPSANPTLVPSHLPSSALPTAEPTPQATEPPILLGMTALHNELRASVNPPAYPPEPPLQWDEQIAIGAQAWASNCTYGHGGDGADILGYGQNIFASFGLGSSTASEVFYWWGPYEKTYYDYATNSCLDGVDCGHYTQIIWASTTSIGCGFAICTVNNPWGSQYNSFPWLNWVCNYNPSGNNYVQVKGDDFEEELPYNTKP